MATSACHFVDMISLLDEMIVEVYDLWSHWPGNLFLPLHLHMEDETRAESLDSRAKFSNFEKRSKILIGKAQLYLLLKDQMV